MITLAEMRSTANNYTAEKAHIGVIGSHSALAMGMARKLRRQNIISREKGRDALMPASISTFTTISLPLEKFKDI